MLTIFFQYLHGWQRYNEAVAYALREPKYRNKVWLKLLLNILTYSFIAVHRGSRQ